MSGFIRLRSITGKLLVAILAVFLLAMAYQYAAFLESYRSRQRLTLALQASVTHAAAAAADDTLKDTIVELTSAWASEDNRTPKHRKSVLKALLAVHPDWINAGLIDTREKPVSSTTANSGKPIDQHLAGPELATEPTVSPVVTEGNTRIFVVSAPVSAPGKDAVVAYAVVSSEAVLTAIKNTVGRNSVVRVVDANGDAVCEIGPKSPGRPVAAASALVSTPEESEMTVRLRSADWRVVAHDYGNAIGESNQEWLPRAIITSLAAAMLALMMGKHIANPIRKLSRAAAAVAVGDLRRRVVINTGDELQSLAQSFNTMAENLEQHERDLRTKTRVQQTLFELAGTITSSLDVTRVAKSITDALSQHFHATEVVVFGRNDLTDKLEPVPVEAGTEVHASTSLTRLAEHAFTSPSALSIPSTIAYPGGVQESTAVALPLVVGNARVGVLAATLTPGEAWDTELKNRLELLETFASLAGIALHNAYIHGRTEDFMKMLNSHRRVTEAISSSLDLKQVLHALVKTTCEVMHAKACAILLSDQNGQLAVAEAFNLSKDFRDKLNITPGEPWTGVAFSEKRTIVREDICSDADLRLREEVEMEGLRGFMCSPLLAANDAIGTINVWMAEPYTGRGLEVHLLASIASHAAAVIANAKLFGREYQIAETLQDTLKGDVPARIGRLTFGHKYIPALDEASVGGDLYDVVTLANGKVALVVADVAGKGIRAAVHTAMVRYMLRGFLYQWPDSPASALDLLNKAAINYSDGHVLVTVFCAVIDPETGWMTYANGGHPPGIVIAREGKQLIHLYRTGMPIGATEECCYQDRKIRLEPGSSLLLYTDGVIEAKRQGSMLGIEGLEDILFDNAGLGPIEMAETVCRETSDYAQCDLKDDIALIAAGFEK